MLDLSSSRPPGPCRRAVGEGGGQKVLLLVVDVLVPSLPLLTLMLMLLVQDLLSHTAVGHNAVVLLWHTVVEMGCCAAEKEGRVIFEINHFIFIVVPS